MRTSASSLQRATAWHDGGMLMGMHWAWWLFWVLTVLFLLWGFRLLLRDRSATRRRLEREEAAERILRAAYAKGEISEDEFDRRLRVLRETHQPG